MSWNRSLMYRLPTICIESYTYSSSALLFAAIAQIWHILSLLFRSTYFMIFTAISSLANKICKNTQLIFKLENFPVTCYWFLVYIYWNQRIWDLVFFKFIEICFMVHYMAYFSKCSIHIWKACTSCSCWVKCSVCVN